MRTIKEVCRLTGVTARTLRYYDAIGLLTPGSTTEAGYRLYSDGDLERLGQILLLKELGFRLQEIKDILNDPNFDKENALDQQIALLSLKKERLESILSFAEQIKKTGVYTMDFTVFNNEKAQDYAAEAKKKWGKTEAYREYAKKHAGDSPEKQNILAAGLMSIFAELGAMKDSSPADAAVQAQIKKLRDFITENYYTCTDTILAGLGGMYAAGGEMTDNIDAAGGAGTALFASKAIAVFAAPPAP